MSAITNELAIHHPGAKQHGVEECVIVSYRPVNPVSNDSDIVFQVNGTGRDYILLSDSKIYCQLRVLRADGDAVVAGDNVAFVNLSLHSLFRQVDISLNQQIITSNIGVNYPYKAIFDVLLKYQHAMTECHLESAGFFKDQAHAMDTIASNSGHLQRRALAQQGWVDFEGVLHMDVAQQPKAILNGVQLGVKLHQHDDSFRLISDGTEYTVEIKDAELRLCQLRVSPTVMLAHSERLAKSPAVYPFYKSSVKAFAIPKGSFNWSIDDIFHGLVPNKLIVAFVSSAAYNGTLGTNPFNFRHFDLSYLEFARNSRSVPAPAFQPKFTANTAVPGEYCSTGYVNSFLSLFNKRHSDNETNFIRRGDYPGEF